MRLMHRFYRHHRDPEGAQTTRDLWTQSQQLTQRSLAKTFKPLELLLDKLAYLWIYLPGQRPPNPETQVGMQAEMEGGTRAGNRAEPQ